MAADVATASKAFVNIWSLEETVSRHKEKASATRRSCQLQKHLGEGIFTTVACEEMIILVASAPYAIIHGNLQVWGSSYAPNTKTHLSLSTCTTVAPPIVELLKLCTPLFPGLRLLGRPKLEYHPHHNNRHTVGVTPWPCPQMIAQLERSCQNTHSISYGL